MANKWSHILRNISGAGCPSELQWIVDRILKQITVNLVHRGEKDTIRSSKEGRRQLYLSLSNENRSAYLLGFNKEWSWLNGKIPVHDYPLIRLVNTALSLTKTIRLNPEINLTNIEGLKKAINNDYVDYIPGFWSEMGWTQSYDNINPSDRKGPFPKFKHFHFTAKKGPNGPAFHTFFEDLLSLTNEQLEAIKVVGGKTLTRIIESWFKVLSIVPYTYSYQYTRKITAISDKEGKTREIAILDYISQAALRPLHDYLFNILKTIRQDCTFSQSSFKQKLNFNVNEFNSIDLKAATDRFPIQVISDVLRYRLGKDYAKAWEYLMVGEPFWCADMNRNVSYSVGNPMGAYSSWASFAISHHFIVYMACQRVGLKWKTVDYVLLGDDIVINNDKVANEYWSIMASLNVEISADKSHKSKTFIEFAKRVIYNGEEVTAFPVNAMYFNTKQPFLIVADILDINQKGWNLADPISFILSYMGRVGYSSKQRKAWKPKLVLIDTWCRLFRGEKKIRNVLECLQDFQEPLNWFCSMSDTEKDFASFQAIRTSILNILVGKDFGSVTRPARSVPYVSREAEEIDAQPTDVLGLKSLQTQLYWMDCYYEASKEQKLTPLRSMLNILDVTQGLINQRELLEIKTSKAGNNPNIDWKLLLEIAVHPLTDDMYIIEKKTIRARVGMKLIEEMKNYIHLIEEFGIAHEFQGQKLSESEYTMFHQSLIQAPQAA